ncbi:unnamed protein product [Rhizophagus irregularis]|nr:unnamed protein product [Rhizophagus irregularis]
MDEIEVETQNNTFASAETKIDIHDNDNIKEHRVETEKTPSEMKDDSYEQHRKSICQILVSQYMNDEGYGSDNYGSDNYVVTYSREDKSFLGWPIKENGLQQHDVYFKLE